MRLEFERVDTQPGIEVDADIDAAGNDSNDGTVRWTVTNTTAERVAVERVRLRWRMGATGKVRMLGNGWQPWSPTGGGVVGIDRDLSLTEAIPRFMRAGYHADPEVASADELRSELVTVVADDDGVCCVGLAGGDLHDGTIRV